MSVETEIAQLETNLSKSYLSVVEKKGSLPVSRNFDNLSKAIDSIPLKLFNANYYIDTSGVVHNIVNGSSTLNATATSLSGYTEAYYHDSTVAYVDLSNIETVNSNGLTSGFRDTSNLNYADLSSVKTVRQAGLQSAFRVSKIKKANLSSLKTVETNGCNFCFTNDTVLEDIDISSLEEVGQLGLNSFVSGCIKLKKIMFTLLNKITEPYALRLALSACSALEDAYFNSLNTSSFGTTNTSQFLNMMQDTGTDVVHTLHFPSNMESTIETLDGYPLFGGTSGYVVCAFDLPATS